MATTKKATKKAAAKRVRQLADVPVTVWGSLVDPHPVVVLGNQAAGNRQVWVSPVPVEDAYYFVVIDTSTLQLATQFVVPSLPKSVPPQLAPYVGKSGYLLVMTTQAMRITSAPQRAFYDALVSMGAGSELARMRQLAEQSGAGLVIKGSYALACTTDLADGKGFEHFDNSDAALLTFVLRPIEIQGKVRYFPTNTSV